MNNHIVAKCAAGMDDLVGQHQRAGEFAVATEAIACATNSERRVH